MAKAGVYAYSTKGVWTVAIMTNGTLQISSNYQSGKNYRFNMYSPKPALTSGFPKYLYALVTEAWGLLDEAQVTLRDGE